LEFPIPPIPTTAIFSLSLGARLPRPLITELGSIVRPAATAPVVPRNERRVMLFEFSFIALSLSWLLFVFRKNINFSDDFHQIRGMIFPE
jgi:hypothetical protein